MTEPYEDPQQIDKDIYACVIEQRRLNRDYREAIAESARDEADHKVAFAKARILIRDQAILDKVKVTEGALEDSALAATEDSYRRYKLSGAKADAIKQSMLSVRSQLDGFRSLSASHRELGG